MIVDGVVASAPSRSVVVRFRDDVAEDMGRRHSPVTVVLATGLAAVICGAVPERG